MSRPFRYNLIVGLVGFASLMAAVGGWRYARASAPVAGPIVIISIDGLRADRLPIYGAAEAATPAIDRLAADGIVFERAYSHVPQTLPAHAALLTGRLPFETGVRDNVGFTVKPAERLLAEMLRDRGYRTGAVVSSYLLRKATGIDQGFTFFDEVPGGPLPASLQRDGAESVDIGARWLESAGDRAFLFLHLTEPHQPYRADAPHVAAYGDRVAQADALVGRFIQLLKSHQQYDQTTILLLSDHGEGLDDHGERRHGLLVYEESVRTPLVVKPAGRSGQGRRVRIPVQHVDIVPTILDLAKAPFPDRLRGRSLRPLLENEGETGWDDRLIYSESLYARYHFGWSGIASVTDGRYRYIQAPRPELYDLTTDAAQQSNVAAETQAAPLATALEQLTGDAAAHPQEPVHAEDRARLATLGYVGTYNGPADADREAIDPKDKTEVVDAYRDAVATASEGRWAAALKQFEMLARVEPAMADVWTQLADAALEADRADVAADAYTRALALAPEETAAHLGLSRVMLRLRRYDEARRHAARAEALDPSIPMRTFVEARILFDRGDYLAAQPLFDRALSGLAQSTTRDMAQWRYYAAETLLRLARDAEGESLLTEELARFPRNARARAALAVLYHRTGRTDEAAAALNALVELSPTPEGYALAARTWSAVGNPEAAATARAAARTTQN